MAIGNIDQKKLAELFVRNDEKAIEEIYDALSPLVYGIALKIIKDHSIAEEVMLKTFLHIKNNFTLFDASRENLYVWVVATVRAVVQKELTIAGNQGNRKALSFVDNSGMRKAGAISGSHDIAGNKTVWMDQKQQELLDNVFINGQKINDAARQLGMTESNAKKLLREAINQFRKSSEKA